MMKSSLYRCILVCVICAGASCGTYPCAEAGGLRISPVGFTDAERDTVVVRKFLKNGIFSIPADSFFISAANADFIVSHDTANMVSSVGLLRLVSKYDYEIYLPGANRLYRITEINEPQQEGKKNSIFNNNKLLCGNTIQSYKQDGQLVSAGTFNFDFVYIKK
jgi:hypothetical protein